MKIKSIAVLGRKWRDKVNGNTYHSARCFADGKLVATVPFQYGYGDQYVWNANAALVQAGIIKGTARQSLWSICNDAGTLLITDCADVTKRECVAWGKA